MDLYRINLNLLVALDALLDEQSVTLAAKKIFLTQSAMSNNLQQLREIFKDELLIREKNRMVLTGAAKALQPNLKQVLQDLDNLIKSREFQPKTSSRIFRIGMNDYLAAAVMPLLISLLQKEAPNIKIEVRKLPASQLIGDEPFEHDLGIDGLMNVSTASSIQKQLLFKDTTVFVISRSHPLAKNKKITKTDFLNYHHLGMLPPNPLSPFLLDRTFEKFNMYREMHAYVPFMLAFFTVLKKSRTLIGTVLKSLFLSFDTTEIIAKELPIKIPEFDVHMVWHKRYENDESHLWLRKKILEIGEKVQKHIETNTPFYE